MKVPQRSDYPKTELEAREEAVVWQAWQADKALSIGVITQWQAYFTVLAKKFDLKDEFKENGII